MIVRAIFPLLLEVAQFTEQIEDWRQVTSIAFEGSESHKQNSQPSPTGLVKAVKAIFVEKILESFFLFGRKEPFASVNKVFIYILCV